MMDSLVFISNQERLESAVGVEGCDRVMGTAMALGTYHDVDVSGRDTADCIASVNSIVDTLDRRSILVILGGYAVVPGVRFDCLSNRLRKAVRGSGDLDDWVVWCDDQYAMLGGSELPRIPVSRIPDGASSETMLRQLATEPAFPAASRFGIRNSKRQYGGDVFSVLDGPEDMLVSHPTAIENLAFRGATSHAYFVLHGAEDRGQRYWGEYEDGRSIEALNTDSIDQAGGVVFSAACWGGLIANVKASTWDQHSDLRCRTEKESIAIAYLKSGASGFVGSTGSHYSPMAPPFGSYGQPLHMEFWNRVVSGSSPARALLEAKVHYASGAPYRSRDAIDLAIEAKTLREFTCLGLGM